MDSNKSQGAVKFSTQESLELQTVDLHSKVDNAVDESTANVKEGFQTHVPHKNDVYTYTVAKSKGFFNFLRSLKLELITFVYMFGYVIRSVSSMTMIMDKICYVNLNYPDEVCTSLHLPKYAEEKLKVEAMANNYHIGQTLIAVLPSAVLGCFIGPWSDKYSRKIPIIAAIIGSILDGFGAISCAYYLRSDVVYYLLPPIFTGLSGGFIAVLTIVFSYTSDISTTENRTIKYALLEMALGMGPPLGLLAGGFIYDKYGYVPVFVTSVCCHSFGLFLVAYILPETRGIGNKDSWRIRLRHFFSFKNVIDGFKAITKKRPNNVRKQLWLLLAAMIFSFFAFAGTINVNYTYTHHHYDWENKKYSTVAATFATMGLVIMTITVPLSTKVFRLKDTTLGIAGSVSTLAKTVVIALAYNQGLYYLGSLLGLLGALTNLAGRSRISKIIPKDDIGKIFTFLATFETTIPLMASAAVIQLFNHTVGIIPDPTYSLMSAILLLTVVIFIILAFMPVAKNEQMQETAECVPDEKESATE